MELEAKKFQEQVIKEVIENLRPIFNNEGLSEETLEKLKKLWEFKLAEKSQVKQHAHTTHQSQLYAQHDPMQMSPGMPYPAHHTYYHQYYQGYYPPPYPYQQGMPQGMRPHMYPPPPGGQAGKMPPQPHQYMPGPYHPMHYPQQMGGQQQLTLGQGPSNSAFQPPHHQHQYPMTSNLGKRSAEAAGFKRELPHHEGDEAVEPKAKRLHKDSHANNDGLSDDEDEDDEEEDDEEEDEDDEEDAKLFKNTKSAQKPEEEKHPIKQEAPSHKHQNSISHKREPISGGGTTHSVKHEVETKEELKQTSPMKHEINDFNQSDNSEEEEDEYQDEVDTENSEESEAEDLVNAQFESVKRTKHKFHCVLSDVMVHINGKDLILKKLTADVFY